MGERRSIHALLIWALTLVLIIVGASTFATISRLDTMGEDRDRAVGILRGRRAFLIEMIGVAEVPEGYMLPPERLEPLLAELEELTDASDPDPRQIEGLRDVLAVLEEARTEPWADVLARARPLLEKVYAHDMERVDAFRDHFARLGMRGPKLLLVAEIAATLGLVLAGTLVTLEFRRRDRVERLLRDRDVQLSEAERLARLGHWELDWRTKRIVWSETLHELFHVPPQYFGGSLEDALVFIHPEDRGRVRESFAEMVEKKATGFDQFRAIVDDQVRVIFQRATPVMDENGDVVRIFGIAQDVTEQVERESAVRASEARFRALCDSAPVAIFQARSDGSSLYTSRRWQEITGQTSEQSAGRGWLAAIHPDDREEVGASWGRAVGRHAIWVHEHRVLRSDGAVRWVRALASPIIDHTGGITGLIGTVEDITERRAAERFVQDTQARLRTAIRATRQLVYEWNSETGEIVWDGSSEELLGLPLSALGNFDAWTRLVHPDDVAAFHAETTRVHANREPFSLEYRVRRADGTYAHVHDRGYYLDDGESPRMVGVVADLSERKRMEQQLLHAQRLESIGRLAGGIAHDFNNWLTAIIAHAAEARATTPDAWPLAHSLDQILAAADSAADLTRQLLAFARKQVIEAVVANPGTLVRRASALLGPLVGSDVTLSIQAAPDLWSIRVDPGQFEQVLVNLAVNARDAMPHGGRLTVSLENVAIGANANLGSGDEAPPPPGEYVLLTVADDGVGIPQEDMDRIFEPFFTTKELGKGTGLGLPTVLGIVTQSGGYVRVSSRMGEGTAFRLYFPRAIEEEKPQADAPTTRAPARPAPALEPAPGSSAGTILLVEDQVLVRDLVARVLTSRGYRVLVASDGPEALGLADSHIGTIDLLLTDLVLPNLGGRALATELLRRRPGLRVLYTSGYTEQPGGLEPGVNFLQKPYGPEALAAAVRRVLSLPPPETPA